MMTCRYCRLPHIPGDGHYAECVVIRRIFGPAQRMCRRCANDAAPRRLLCAECQKKYKPVHRSIYQTRRARQRAERRGES